MIDDCEEIETGHEEFEKNPWLIPPSMLKFPCDVERDIREWGIAPSRLNSNPIGYSILLLEDVYPSLEVEDFSASDRDTFKKLVPQWKEETWFVSSIKKRVSHPAYLKIIGLGRVAIPWILEELRREPDYWYAALEAIARPDHPPQAETMSQLRDAWLAWGKANGYIG